MSTFTAWFQAPWINAVFILACTAIILTTIIIGTRVVGLRSFSKMSGFDFAVTIAIGSIAASSLTGKTPPTMNAIFALVAIFLLQYVLSSARRMTWFSRLVDNQPMLLMQGPNFLRDNMRRCHVTEADIRGKLREANVLSYDQVRAVVFEATGDISVLHGAAKEDGGTSLSSDLLEGVRLS